MDDIRTQNESIALYRFVCNRFVGNEDHVKTLRMMNAVRDILASNNVFTKITSGSFGEGLQMQGSDIDVMCVLKESCVCEDINIQMHRNTAYFIIETENTQPGYVQLRLVYNGNKNILGLSGEIKGERYFSNDLFKKRFLDEELGGVIHGPCISDKYDFHDCAVCLHSKSWVIQAEEWITRSNTSWPGSSVKQNIINHGVLFVPIGIKGSKNEDLEWRMSFSVGEKFLIFTFTHTQLLCYVLLKILLKNSINIDLGCKELLCSYHMKTVMFWISEELPSSEWRPENLTSCFMRCLRRLIYFVEFSMCPHYFIPENNLFENKMKGQSREILLNKLHIFNSFGWQCIASTGIIPSLFALILGNMLELRSVNVICLQKLLFSRIHTVNKFVTPAADMLKKGIYFNLSSKSNKIKRIFLYYMSIMRRLETKKINFCNKQVYQQCKTCLCSLLQKLYHDAATGWIMIASFFYSRKQYDIAFDILQYSLSKCTPEKLHPQLNMSQIHKELLNVHIFRKMNGVHLLKTMLIDTVFFFHDCMVIPDELNFEVMMCMYYIPSVVYSHFLRFLCHYHLENTRKSLDCLRDIQLAIDVSYFIENPGLKGISYNILGIAIQLMGDKESAKQAFMQSMRLFPYREYNTACLRLSLLC